MSKKDFRDFLKNEKANVPDQLNQSIMNMIHQDLNPDQKIVFTKLLLVQGFVGAITMAFCPQFEFSFTNNYDVFHFFHHTFGMYGCMVACGTVFMGSGAVFASILLSAQERLLISQSKFLYYTSVTGVAVATFMLFGAKVYFDLTGLWILGSIVSGALFFQASSSFKNFLLRSSF